MREDKTLVKQILVDTVTLLCRNGLNFQSDLSIQAVIGITIDKSDSLIIHIDKNVERGSAGMSQLGNDQPISDSSVCEKSSETAESEYGNICKPHKGKYSHTECRNSEWNIKTNVENVVSENSECRLSSSDVYSDHLPETVVEKTLKSVNAPAVEVQQATKSTKHTTAVNSSIDVSKDPFNTSRTKSFMTSACTTEPMESSDHREHDNTTSDCSVDEMSYGADTVDNVVDKQETQQSQSCLSVEPDTNFTRESKSKHDNPNINEDRQVLSCSSVESVQDIKSETTDDIHQATGESIPYLSTKSSGNATFDSVKNLPENVIGQSRDGLFIEGRRKRQRCQNLISPTAAQYYDDVTECCSERSTSGCEAVVNITGGNHRERVVQFNCDNDAIKLEDESDDDVKQVEYLSDSDNHLVNHWSSHGAARLGTEEFRNVVALSQTRRFGSHVAFDSHDSERAEFIKDMNSYRPTHRLSEQYASPHASYHRSTSSQYHQTSGGPSGDGLSRYVCNYDGCDASFTHKQNLQRHQSLKHGRERTSRRSRRSNALNYLMTVGGDSSTGVYFEDVSTGSDCYVDNSNNSF